MLLEAHVIKNSISAFITVCIACAMGYNHVVKTKIPMPFPEEAEYDQVENHHFPEEIECAKLRKKPQHQFPPPPLKKCQK
ncbi:hypothetical protein [Anaplasma platys]|uniref:hypothetical protein n=1 Tax=Anaplasma platys TaxID=949 RepID=UPI001F3937C2|nr:hypothetical protein [Anaplasma platys]